MPDPNSTLEIQVPQASAIPYRRKKNRAEFCLITSRRSGTWGFPKGMIDPGETIADAALKEALEEAGLQGKVVGKPLGKYTYNKHGMALCVTSFLMEVEKTLDEWPESSSRERRWVTAREARKLLTRPNLRSLLDAAVEALKS